jgi:hypothetical protein
MNYTASQAPVGLRKLNGPEVPWLHAFPELSPDGAYVLYTSARDATEANELYIVPVAGGTPLKLDGPTLGRLYTTNPSFTPDSSRVIYQARRDAADSLEIFSVPSDGGEPVKLNGPLVAGGSAVAPVINADGSRIIYLANQETKDYYGLYIVPTAGGTPVKISAGLQLHFTATLSADGSSVLIETRIPSKPTAPNEIYSRVVRERWNGGAGDWDATANWDKGETPDEVMQVAIAGPASVVAAGVAVNRVVNELRLGGGAETSTLTLQSDASITAINGVVIESNGVLGGNGSIIGNVSNSGILAPGASPGSLNIDGDYSQTAAGRLSIELVGATSFDRLPVTDHASFDGTLAVSLINGFTPSAGQTFDIIDFGTLSGTFDTVQLPTLAGPLSWDTSRLYSNGSLSIVGGLAGDFNINGFVDAADYVVWRNLNGEEGSALAADGNGDGVVNAADYGLWRAHFGQTTASNSSLSSNNSLAAVPEPCMLMLIPMGFVPFAWRRSVVRNTASVTLLTYA